MSSNLHNKAMETGFGNSPQELEINDVPVQGEVPAWLKGTLLRNGPGAFSLEHQQLRHWFDGLAMLHRFSFDNGRVSYSNRYLESDAVNAARKEGRISYSEFATDPCRSLFKRMTAIFDQKLTDSAKVNIAKFSDRFLALGETPMQIEFDPQTLRKTGTFMYDPQETQHVTTVHPHFDAEGNAYNLVTNFDRVSEYRIMRIRPDGEREIVARHKVTFPGYIHSWGMSEKHFILVEYPFVVYPLKLLFQLRPFIENFAWKPSRGTRIFVFDRSNGALKQEIKTDAFFAFHHLNAWEEGSDLVFDLNTYEDASIISAFYLDRLKDKTAKLPLGHMDRFRVNLENGELRRKRLSDANIELARYDDGRFYLQPGYRYIYGVSVNTKAHSSFYNQIIRIDAQTGESRNWYEEGCYPGEPVYVARPGGADEQDGVVLSVVLDAKKGQSFLLLLDAADFSERARAVIPQPVLFGYHGGYYPD